MFYRYDPFAPRRPQNYGRLLSADVYRIGDTYHVEIDVPGVDLEDIDVEMEKRQLKVTVERRALVDEDRTDVVRGRPTGTFSRRFFLSDALDSEDIEASYDRGVLKLTIPVVEKAKARKIAIQGGTSAPSLEN